MTQQRLLSGDHLVVHNLKWTLNTTSLAKKGQQSLYVTMFSRGIESILCSYILTWYRT